jgi:reactive intermediate/imine deaminase
MKHFRFALLGVSLLVASPEPSEAQLQRSNPQGMSQPTTYSHVVRAGNLLFIAGQVSTDSAGQLVGAGDMRAQVKQVLENLKRALASQGADFSHVAKINTFTTDIEAFLTAREVREEYFKGHPPASTLVEIKRLARPEFLVEIEAIALLPN